jgi:hypothetical protein
MNDINLFTRPADQALPELIHPPSPTSILPLSVSDDPSSTELSLKVGQQAATSPVLYQEQSPLASLPSENLVSIFLRLRLSDYKNLMLVCRQFKIILTENESFFQGLLSRYFPNYLSSSSPTPVQDYERAFKTRYGRYWNCSVNLNQSQQLSGMPFCINQTDIYLLNGTKIEGNKRNHMKDTRPCLFDSARQENERFQHVQSEGNFLFAMRNNPVEKNFTVLTLYELNKDSVDVDYVKKIELKIQKCVDAKLYVKEGKPILLTLSHRESNDVIETWEPNDKMEKLESKIILHLNRDPIRSCCAEFDFEGNQLFLGDSTGITIWKQNEAGSFAKAGSLLDDSNKNQPKRILFKDGFLCVQTKLSLTVWKKNEKNYSPVLATKADGFSFHHQELTVIRKGAIKLYKISNKGNLEEKKRTFSNINHSHIDVNYFVIENRDGCLVAGSENTMMSFDFTAPKKEIFECLQREFKEVYLRDLGFFYLSWISHLKERLLAMPEADLGEIFEYLRDILKLSSVKEARDAFNGHHEQQCSPQQVAQAIGSYLDSIRNEENTNPVTIEQLKIIHALQRQVMLESRSLRERKSLQLFDDSSVKNTLKLADEVYDYAISIKDKNSVSPKSKEAMQKMLQAMQELLKNTLKETVNQQESEQNEQEIETDCLQGLITCLYGLINDFASDPKKTQVIYLSLTSQMRGILFEEFLEIVEEDGSEMSWEQGSNEQRQGALFETISTAISSFSDQLDTMKERREGIESLVDKLAAFDCLMGSRSEVPQQVIVLLDERRIVFSSQLGAIEEQMAEVVDHAEGLVGVDFQIDPKNASPQQIVTSQNEEYAASLAADQLKVIREFNSQLEALVGHVDIQVTLKLAREVYDYADFIEKEELSPVENRKAMGEVLQKVQALLEPVLTRVIEKQKEQQIQINFLNSLESHFSSDPREASKIYQSLNPETKELLRQSLIQIIGDVPLSVLRLPFTEWGRGSDEDKLAALRVAISELSNQLNAMKEDEKKIMKIR